MEAFLKEIVSGEKYELLIDTKIFNKDIILKSAYNFLDKGYFFFKEDEKENIILHFTKKGDVEDSSEVILANYSDELLSVYLRDKLEKDNKVIRETIVGAAISNSLDSNNFQNINVDSNNEENQIDFDKDIEDILREIENDPELKIDEAEIEKILREIEEETESEIDEEPKISLDKEAFKEVKNNFKKK